MASELRERANTPSLNHVGVAGVQGEGVLEVDVDARESMRRSDAPGGKAYAGEDDMREDDKAPINVGGRQDNVSALRGPAEWGRPVESEVFSM